MSSDIVSQAVLSRQAFTMANVTFLDARGIPYTPAVVEKRVVVASTPVYVITNWTPIGGFVSGDDIQVTANETELIDTSLIVEKHIVLVVGDRGTPSENPQRVIVQVKNREMLP